MNNKFEWLEPSPVSQLTSTAQRATAGAAGDITNALLSIYGHASNIPEYYGGMKPDAIPHIDVEALKATQGHRTMPKTEDVSQGLIGLMFGGPEVKVAKEVGPLISSVDEVLTGVPAKLKSFHGSASKEFAEDASKHLWSFKNPNPAQRYTRGAKGAVHEIETVTSNPMVYDAAGAPIGKFQANKLDELKGMGHDALVLKNVRIPDGSLDDVVIKISK